VAILRGKKLKIKVVSKHDELKTQVGHIEVDLLSIATGVEEHNLPILDGKGKNVGRLSFWVEMAQVSNVAVIFREVKMSNLPPADKDVIQGLNPYLKYGYSKTWTSIEDGKKKAQYSEIQFRTTNPTWVDLPELRFKAPLKELVHESIVLHVTHKGTLHNTTVARCNLLFRTLVDNGKSFKEEDVIKFKGPLKVGDATIEGHLVFKFLPQFAQMKPVNVIRRPLRTEDGILDATLLLPWLPRPKIPVIISEEGKGNPSKALDTNRFVLESPKGGRARANTLMSPSTKNTSKMGIKEPEGEKKSFNKTATTDDLITFTPPVTRRPLASSGGTMAPTFNPTETSDPTVITTSFGNFVPSQPSQRSFLPFQRQGSIISLVSTPQSSFLPTATPTNPFAQPLSTANPFSAQQDPTNPFKL